MELISLSKEILILIKEKKILLVSRTIIFFLKKSISEHLENKYRYWPAVTENFMQYKEMKPKKLNILSSKSYFPETILPCSSFYAVLALRKGQKDW